MVRKIAVVTGSRAEYGFLYSLLQEIQTRPTLDLKLMVTGMHLSPEFGLTYRQIEQDGFHISEKIEILLSADTDVAISTSIGLAIIRFSAAFDQIKPDIVLLIGDRFESLAAATAAMVARIPIAHIAGGHTTEGVMDEAIRHSITKMSHLHFTSHQQNGELVVQMGESPGKVHVTGTLCLDGIRTLQRLGKAELEAEIGMDLNKPFFLVVYHPVTLEHQSAGWQMDNLLAVLSRAGYPCIFVMPNADTGGRIIFDKIRSFVDGNPASKAFTSLERNLYLNLMNYAHVLVGNSSSGIMEASSFGLAAVNIGDRQKGRIRAANVIDCGYPEESIAEAIDWSLDSSFRESLSGLSNPYGDGHASKRIADVLEQVELDQELLKKRFHRVNLSDEDIAAMNKGGQ